MGAADDERPWVLITRLPGQAEIVPADPREWAAQLGSTLARIHTTSAAPIAGLDSVFERRGRDRLFGPAAEIVDDAWEERVLAAPVVLTHGDFHSGNVLWEHGILSGVIDWEGAVRGPAGHDIGWCRLDLYLLYDEQIADHFLAAYESATATTFGDPLLWDLWSLARSHVGVESWVPNYRDLGRADLNAGELRRRHDAWTAKMRGRPSSCNRAAAERGRSSSVCRTCSVREHRARPGPAAPCCSFRRSRRGMLPRYGSRP